MDTKTNVRNGDFTGHGMQQSVDMRVMIRSGVQLEIMYFVFAYIILQAGADPEVVSGG